MPTAGPKEHPYPTAAEKAKATRAINGIRYNLTGQFMTELKYLAKSIGMDYNGMVRSCWGDKGKTDMDLAEAYLNLIYKKLINQADELKATDDRILKDVPDAASILLRIHFIDGQFVKAAQTASRFNIPDRLQDELTAAYATNLKVGRTWTAEQLQRKEIQVGKLPSGQLSSLIIERDLPSTYKKMLRQVP